MKQKGKLTLTVAAARASKLMLANLGGIRGSLRVIRVHNHHDEDRVYNSKWCAERTSKHEGALGHGLGRDNEMRNFHVTGPAELSLRADVIIIGSRGIG